MQRRAFLLGTAALVASPAQAGFSIGDSTFGGLSGACSTTPPWVLSGAAYDFWFASNGYFGGNLTSTVRATPAIAYATNLNGTLTGFAPNTNRIGVGTGLLVEESRTNVVLWNRDLTNVAWTKSNTTAAKDQTGADGTANAASSLTATAANGTCLQAITLGSSARFQTAYVKRITGTGVINMTMDNGSTWTAITVTSSYSQLSIPTQTLANPTVGFRIVTSGDKIAIDLVQNEGGTSATSPIPVTTVAVTRAADDVSLTGAALTLSNADTKSVVCAFYTSGSTRAVAFSTNAGVPGFPDFSMDAGSAGQFRTYIETGTTDFLALTLGAWTANVTGKVGLASSGGSASAVANGGSVTTGTYTSPQSGESATQLGSFAGLLYLNGYISRLTLWNSKLADATLQGFTV